jgi:hypothetical protein
MIKGGSILGLGRRSRGKRSESRIRRIAVISRILETIDFNNKLRQGKSDQIIVPTTIFGLSSCRRQNLR